MAANLQAHQGLTPTEYLATALVFIDKCRKELGTAPKHVRDELDLVRDDVDNFASSLPDTLYEAIWDENRECEDCCYCVRDKGGPWDESLRECQVTTAKDCPAVAELLGGA